MLEEYAQKNNFYNIKFYVDDGYSGTNFNRPAFKELIKNIDSGLVGTVIVKDMSRLGRDYLKVGYYSEVYFGEAGADEPDFTKISGEFATSQGADVLNRPLRIAG